MVGTKVNQICALCPVPCEVVTVEHGFRWVALSYGLLLPCAGGEPEVLHVTLLSFCSRHGFPKAQRPVSPLPRGKEGGVRFSPYLTLPPVLGCC